MDFAINCRMVSANTFENIITALRTFESANSNNLVSSTGRTNVIEDCRDTSQCRRCRGQQLLDRLVYNSIGSLDSLCHSTGIVRSQPRRSRKRTFECKLFKSCSCHAKACLTTSIREKIGSTSTFVFIPESPTSDVWLFGRGDSSTAMKLALALGKWLSNGLKVLPSHVYSSHSIGLNVFTGRILWQLQLTVMSLGTFFCAHELISDIERNGP